MTRAVVALPAVPAVEGGAAGRCALALLAGLREHGVDVTALAAATGPHPPAPPPAAGVRVVPVADPRSRLRVNVDRVRRPRGELSWTPFADQVRQAAAAADVLHLEQVESGWLSADVQVPAVVHLHHLVRADRDLGLPWTSGFREVLEFAAGERAAMRRHRWVLVSSPVVRDAVRRAAPRARLVEAPLSLLPEHYPAAPLDGPPVAGIIGTGTWAPTARAIERLVREVWPRVLRRLPDARLRVAGRGTSHLPVLRDVPRGVEVLGEVPDAGAFLRGLSVLAYPLDRGSGMKVKVLEALASGLPVVTTARGGEGLLDGAGTVVSERDDVLAEAVVDLLRDAGARREVGDQARAHFLARYAPAPATAPVAAAYQVMMEA